MSEALIILYVLTFWTLALIVAAVVLRVVRGRPTTRDTQLEELRARYARGELSWHEYEMQRKHLERASERRAS